MEVQCRKQGKTQFPDSNVGEGSRASSCSLFLSWPAHPQALKNLPANAVDKMWVQSLGWEDPLKEGMATHSSILA